MIRSSLLPIITLPIITYYCKFIIMHYYILITSLLHPYYILITNGKSCYNDSIIVCSHPLLHHYYLLLLHYYTSVYNYPLLPISVSRTCRWKGNQNWRWKGKWRWKGNQFLSPLLYWNLSKMEQDIITAATNAKKTLTARH